MGFDDQEADQESSLNQGATDAGYSYPLFNQALHSGFVPEATGLEEGRTAAQGGGPPSIGERIVDMKAQQTAPSVIPRSAKEPDVVAPLLRVVDLRRPLAGLDGLMQDSKKTTMPTSAPANAVSGAEQKSSNRDGVAAAKPVAPSGRPSTADQSGRPAAATPALPANHKITPASKPAPRASTVDPDRGLLNRSRKTDYSDYTFQGGHRSFRNNNPSNIKMGPIARQHGAIGRDSDGFAIFPDWQTGLKAQSDLWKDKRYQDKSLDAAVRLWTSGDPKAVQDKYIADIAKAAGVTADKKISGFTPSQMEALYRVQQKHESGIGGKIIYKPDRTLAQVAGSWTAGMDSAQQKAYVADLARRLSITESAKMGDLTEAQRQLVEDAHVGYMGLHLRSRPSTAKPQARHTAKPKAIKHARPATGASRT
ncbi:MAG TPA: hypothetical protein VNW97_14515 [Candidatus Saccharimonadales bacterium]|jgi:hypothetical protein|nr:hypothetical protein [Candidatus Saccharimonadales bacterium]